MEPAYIVLVVNDSFRVCSRAAARVTERRLQVEVRKRKLSIGKKVEVEFLTVAVTEVETVRYPTKLVLESRRHCRPFQRTKQESLWVIENSNIKQKSRIEMFPGEGSTRGVA